MLRHVLFAMIVVLAPMSARADGPKDSIGVRGGYAVEPGQLVIGGQMELGPILGPAYFLPVLDAHFGDDTFLLGYAELRWYLLPLPDTGVSFYGSAGPGLVLAGGDGDVGLSLSAGAEIPMSQGRRYNLEARFGIGDLPDLTIALAVLWSL